MKIGNVELENNVFLAPMAGVTDLPFRILCKEMGCGLVYSEMVSAKGILYDNKNTTELLEVDAKERPVAVQLFGSDPEILGAMAKKIEEYPIDIIDVNMGCGGDCEDCRGKRRVRGGSAWQNQRAVLQRQGGLGYHQGSEGGGADSRHWQRRYLHTAGCEKSVGAYRLRCHHGWARCAGELLPEPTAQERVEKALRHSQMLIAYKGEYIGIREMRKHMAWYMKGLPGAAELRGKLNYAETMAEMEALLNEYLKNHQ